MKNKIKEIIAERIKYHSNKQEHGYFNCTFYIISNASIDICASDILEELNKAGYQKIDGDTSDGYHTFNELYHHRADNAPIVCTKAEVVKEFAQKAISRVFNSITQRFYNCYNDGLIKDYPDSELSWNFFRAFVECKDIVKKEINDLADQYGKEEE